MRESEAGGIRENHFPVLSEAIRGSGHNQSPNRGVVQTRPNHENHAERPSEKQGGKQERIRRENFLQRKLGQGHLRSRRKHSEGTRTMGCGYRLGHSKPKGSLRGVSETEGKAGCRQIRAEPKECLGNDGISQGGSEGGGQSESEQYGANQKRI